MKLKIWCSDNRNLPCTNTYTVDSIKIMISIQVSQMLANEVEFIWNKPVEPWWAVFRSHKHIYTSSNKYFFEKTIGRHANQFMASKLTSSLLNWLKSMNLGYMILITLNLGEWSIAVTRIMSFKMFKEFLYVKNIVEFYR